MEEVTANKSPIFAEADFSLDPILEDRIPAAKLRNLGRDQIIAEILKAHEAKLVESSN